MKLLSNTPQTGKGEYLDMKKGGIDIITAIKLFLALFKFETTQGTKKSADWKEKRYDKTLQEIYKARERGIHIGIITPEKTQVVHLLSIANY